MNEKLLATDSRGFSRITQRQVFRGCVRPEFLRTEFLGERHSRINQTPAAKRRHALAPDVSSGYAIRNGTQPRRDGRSYALVSPRSLLVTEVEGAISQSSSNFPHHSELGHGETVSNHHSPLELPANTGFTVGRNPPNFSPWNERDTTCI